LKVSVVITTYKQGRFLADAVTSVLDQDYADKEIIVVNDGSPDDTRRVAATFGDRIAYLEQENGGVCSARNAGIRASTGSYVALLDSDDKLLPGSLTARVDFLNAHAETALVCGDATVFNEAGNVGPASALWGCPRHPANFRWDTLSYCPLPSTVAVRRECFDVAGLFNESLRSGAEDWWMWVTLSRHFNMTYLDRPVAHFRSHPGNVSRDRDRMAAGQRQAVASVVQSPAFGLYPAPFRARLLYFRFATAWHHEPKSCALGYLARALTADPRELPYGLRVIGKGIANTIRRRNLCRDLRADLRRQRL
jgi:glycosyltransferase involved in cell wall biosynthesis